MPRPPAPPLCVAPQRPDPLPFVVVALYVALAVALLAIGLHGAQLQ